MSHTWHKIADSIEEIAFSAEGLAETEAGGRKLCIAKFNGSLFACASKCPHAGGTLAHGYIDGSGNITCPLHHYKFSLAKGRNTSGEGYFLKTYPIEIRPDGIYVGIAVGILNWLK